MDKVWIAERDWGSGRIDFIGVYSSKVKAIAACEETEAGMPAPNPIPLPFDKVDGRDTWGSTIKNHYKYCVWETRIDDE